MTQQLPIEFEYENLYEKQDYVIADNNIEAFTFIDSYPNWNSFAACIYGPKGSGKTHLAHIFAENIHRRENNVLSIPLIFAKDISLESPFSLFEQSRILIIENLDENINEEALFHLFNLYKNEGGTILFTATVPPARLALKLKDLQSRLNSIPSIEISEPSSQLLSMLIVKLFSDRQIEVSTEIIKYIENHGQRSFEYIKKLIKEIDSLSLAKKRAITIHIVKEAMEFLENSSQIELF